MADEAAVKVGGAYKESDDHVPNAADMTGQFNTSGLGASGRIEEVAPVFDVDKVRTAQQIAAALDDDDDTVPSSRVILPNPTDDNESAKKEILAHAKARVKKGVVIGEPSEAEAAAAEEGDGFEDLRAESTASDAPQKQAAARNAGDSSGAKAKKQTAAKKTTAKKTTSSDDKSGKEDKDSGSSS